MSDRLSEIVLGLQRLAEHARLRGDDLRHIQSEERREHAEWLDHQIGMVQEVYRILEAEKRKFASEFQAVQDQRREALPKVVTQGPAKASNG